MVVTARNRYRERRVLQPDFYYAPTGGWQTGGSYVFSSQQTNDWYKKTRRLDGTLPVSTFYSMRVRHANPSRITGQRPLTGVPTLIFQGKATYVIPPTDPSGGWAAKTNWTDAQALSKLLAESNPFRATLSVPVMVAELLEAVSLVKVAVDSILHAAGSTYLNSKFGWEAMFRDVKTLTTITVQIEKRLKEFQSLSKRGGLRRKIEIGKTNPAPIVEPSRGLATDYTTAAYYHVTHVFHERVWGTVRWRPVFGSDLNETIDKITDLNLAARVVLDLDRLPDPSTVWEMVPFSWMIDYFTNFGEILQAFENNAQVEPYDICVMRERTTTSTYVPISIASGLKSTSGVSVRRSKTRTVWNTYPSAASLLHFGLMTSNQAFTLAALVAARSKT